jgi:energy-converting hydrogenase A subunit M
VTYLISLIAKDDAELLRKDVVEVILTFSAEGLNTVFKESRYNNRWGFGLYDP